MKKISSFTIISLFTFFTVFSQSYTLDGIYRPLGMLSSSISILSDSDAKIEINNIDGDCIKNQFLTYKIVHIDGMSFLKFNEPIDDLALEDNLYGKKIKADDKILFLSCIEKNSNLRKNPKTFLSYTRGFSLYSKGMLSCAIHGVEGLPRCYRNCTSYLVEKNKSYPVENLCNLEDSSPWVEAAPGYGIGEGFVIENLWGIVYPTLLIMNGYISYEKPYLYKQNGRIKKIKVTGMKSKKSKILDVLDTPHPQTVDISFITAAEDLQVTIADVYEGTKYEDTCIHFMITWNTEVIPYESEIK